MKNDLDIIGAIKSSGLEVLKDYGDKGLSEFAELFDRQLLSDIPYVNTIVNIASLGTKIRQFYFAKKLVRFLTQLEKIPLHERENFVDRMENSQESKKIGEKLIILIDSLNDDDKAIMLGKLFKRTIENKIDIQTFHRLSISINNIYLADLNKFIELKSSRHIGEDMLSSLYQNGFLLLRVEDIKRQNLKNMTSHGIQNVVQPMLEFQISELGYIFLDNIS